jgi:hypothetical protein
MRYQIAPLFCRPWTLNGISPRLIESHYEHNYGGAISRLIAITEELESLDPGTQGDAFARLKREEMAALNSTLLHELYFASLGGDGRAVPRGDGRCDRTGFRLGRPLAAGIRRSGGFSCRRVWLGPAFVSAARCPADQSPWRPSQPDGRGRHSAPCSRHVRACLSSRIRCQYHRLHRGIHAQHRMECGADALSRRAQGEAAATLRAKAVRRSALRHR